MSQILARLEALVLENYRLKCDNAKLGEEANLQTDLRAQLQEAWRDTDRLAAKVRDLETQISVLKPKTSLVEIAKWGECAREIVSKVFLHEITFTPQHVVTHVRKIAMIKEFRDRCGSGLKEAKDFIEVALRDRYTEGAK
jgi:ribosomal protein L7/L12